MNFSAQVMKEINIPVEIDIHITYFGEIDPRPYVSNNVPYLAGEWLMSEVVREFILSPKEVEMLPQRIVKQFCFEVLVDINSQGKAYRADCQTICPGHVAAWIELEAMKQVNSEAEKCSS